MNRELTIRTFKNSIICVCILLSSFSVKGETNTIDLPDGNTQINYYTSKSKEAALKYDYIQADLFLDTAIEYSLKLQNEKKSAEIFLSKANVKKRLNDFGSALDFYIKAMKSFEQLEDWNNLALTYVDMAEFYRRTENHKEAHDFIRKAQITYAKYQLKDLVLLNKIYNRSAAINNESNPDSSISLKDSREALRIAKIIPDSSLMAVSYNEMGYTYKNLLKVDSAEFFYKQAERLWMGAGKYQEALHAMSNRAQLYQHNNYDSKQVISLYKYIVFLSDSLEVKFPLMNVSWALYNIYMNKGDTTEAFLYFSMHHDETMNVYNSQTRNELYNVNARFQNEKIQYQFDLVSEKLYKSSKNLEENRRQLFYLVLFSTILVLFLMMIVYLFFRLRKSNKNLANKNSEKDTLIQEIHHRVKNNLQFISSLINMQVKTSISDVESSSLHEASRRINAMALVHEMLYNTEDQEGVSVKYYLEELIDSLYAMINSENKKIDFKIDIMEVDLNVSDTISIGIITSELVSNSMKHAFQNVSTPEITISLMKQENNLITYTISDNGLGVKENLNLESTLGLRLVDIFSRQLKGTYSIDGSNGFIFSLNFKTK